MYPILYKYEDGIPTGATLSYNTIHQLQLAGIFRQIRLSDIFLRNSVLDRVIIKFLSGKLVQTDFEK